MSRRRRHGKPKTPFRLLLIRFLPLTLLLLERLLVPLKMTLSTSPMYLDMNSMTSTKKTKSSIDADNEIMPRLDEITKNAGDWMNCPQNKQKIYNSFAFQNRKSSTNIPLVIHQAGISKCLPKELYESTTKWKLPGHDYYFHDQRAVNRLLQHDFPEFPLLRVILRRCVRGFEGKVALWKYLVLYAYGGIFAALGSTPGQNFVDSFDHPQSKHAGLIAGRGGKSLKFEFIAVTPRHPIVYYAIHYYCMNILTSSDVDDASFYYNISFHSMSAATSDFRTQAAKISNGNDAFEEIRRSADNRTSVILHNKEQSEHFFVNNGADLVRGFLGMRTNHSSTSYQAEWRKSCLSEMISDLN